MKPFAARGDWSDAWRSPRRNSRRRRPRTRTPVATATNQSPEILTEGAGARLADIAKALRADVGEIERLCAHLAAALPAPVVHHVALAKQ